MIAALALLLAYLLGTVVGGYWVGRVRGGIDLRSAGSGNVGATNALRTQGKMFAAAVLLIDLIKGVLAVTLLPAWLAPTVDWLPYACGIAVTVGHVFPIWFGFRGGKGAATLAGVFASLMPWAFLWMMAAFVSALLMTGMVAGATLSAAGAAVIYALWMHGLTGWPVEILFVILMAVLVVYTHRGNILRMRYGTESRFDRLHLSRRWRER